MCLINIANFGVHLRWDLQTGHSLHVCQRHCPTSLESHWKTRLCNLSSKLVFYNIHQHTIEPKQRYSKIIILNTAFSLYQIFPCLELYHGFKRCSPYISLKSICYFILLKSAIAIYEKVKILMLSFYAVFDLFYSKF